MHISDSTAAANCLLLVLVFDRLFLWILPDSHPFHIFGSWEAHERIFLLIVTQLVRESCVRRPSQVRQRGRRAHSKNQKNLRDATTMSSVMGFCGCHLVWFIASLLLDPGDDADDHGTADDTDASSCRFRGLIIGRIFCYFSWFWINNQQNM